MRPKTLIVMLVAACCGVVASYLTGLVTAERAVQTEVEKVGVLVARRNISSGTLLTEPEKWFEEKQLIKGEEPQKALGSFDQLKNRRLSKPLYAEQFVTASDLSEPENKDQPDRGPVMSETANPDQARTALPKITDEVKDRQRKVDNSEPEVRRRAFYENALKSFGRVVVDLKQSTRNCKATAEQHRSTLRRFGDGELTLTQYSALQQGQRDQQEMDQGVKRMEARDKRLEKLIEQLRQAVSVRDWELAARVHSRILKECAEATRYR